MQTNSAVVKDLAQHEERRSSAFQLEVTHYLERHPATQYIDILLTDLNGSFRGKRIPVSGLKKIEKGCYFPASVFAMDILGNVVEEAGLGQELGEPDRICMPISGTLTPSAADPEHIGQVLLTMLDEDGTPFDVEPRNVLNRIWQALRQRGLFPVVAVELEFYLIDRQRDPQGDLQPPCAPGTQERSVQSQVYSLDNLNNFVDVLNDIDTLAKLQGLPADGVVAEASPGQFEVNLNHTDNVLQACDHALGLKRLVRQVAEHHGMHATFMAKPYADYAGSGMHVHISMIDSAGKNLFADSEGEDSALLKRVLAGMITLMPASMALLAPNVNAFRRFQPGMYVPCQASWGYNNRTVALRIPCSDAENHRVEYRVAGADANPYLVVAAILAGMLYGLDTELPLPKQVNGNGLEQEGLAFPIRQSDALYEFQHQKELTHYLGERFSYVYHACKMGELMQFERLVTETEIDWMLKNA
ncbi:glutamine synthetase family protein [Serratia sp. UGAL515B_01]|uniref:glutamine synthetase family protein n=1 Tax=Serratia sp. UGAL515B_01 TaxID=2986763 RepID=UPI0029551385|nr:glutamine synthetase family protein [Serratia sp. UGAL515B_01]WON78842.1 glutamine synthetase family protein [Serratia sp. UGAL515B_01]